MARPICSKTKMNAYRGGVVENIYFRNSTMTQTIRGIVNWDTNFSESVPFTNSDIFNPTIRNIFVDNVNTTNTVTTTFQPYVISSAVSRSPVENTYYRNSTFHTTSTFEAAFSNNTTRFFKNFVVENVKLINPSTQATRTYTTFPVNLLDQTTAVVGSRFDPATDGHGFSIEVLPGNRMLADWYVYAPNGGPVWIVATGTISGNTGVLQGFQKIGIGGRFPPDFDPSKLEDLLWGTLIFTFTDCNHGQVSWQPIVGGTPVIPCR